MKKNVVIGIVVLIAAVALFFGLNFLKGKNIFSKERVYYAHYEKVEGLEQADEVTIRGFKVGDVTDVRFTSDAAEKLLVSFTIDGNYKIPKGTVAKIVTTDLMGSRSLELKFPKEITGYTVSGDTLEGNLAKGLKEEVSAQVLPIKAKAEELMGSLDTLLNAAKVIFDSQSQKNLKSSIQRMNATFRNLESTTSSLNEIVTTEEKSIKGILENFAIISKNLAENKGNITRILTNFSNISDTIAQANFSKTLLEFQHALQELTTTTNKINSGEGTVGAMLNDKDLYNRLESATANMDRLLTDIRLNPKKYVNFSLLKTGRTVYYDSEAKKAKSEAKNYRIQVLYSSSPVAIDNPVFKNRNDIIETELKEGRYRYTIGYTPDYKALEKILKDVRKDFPDAYIIED